MSNADEGKFLAEAIRLENLGYKIMPCQPGGKAPATANGLKDATNDSFQIESWWADNPNYNIAIITDGLIVVDRDIDKETGLMNPAFPSSPEREMELAAGPCATTPRGGRHNVFRQRPGKPRRNTVGKLAEHVDTRCDGGYILVYPSIVDGKAYSWQASNPLDVGPDKLPFAPEWIETALDERKPSLVTGTATVDVIQEGGRNDQLARFGGYLRRGGASNDEILAALQVRNLQKCTPPLPDSEVRTIANSVARYEADQIQELIIEGTEPATQLVDPGKFPSHLLRPPGLMRDFIDYAVSGAIRVQPEAILAAAIALMAVITGRKVHGATGLRTNVMAVALCGTGGGKERPRQAIKESIYAANMGHLIPMEEIASSAALLNAVAEQPACLFPIDEMGKFLRTTKDSACNPHVADIIGLLMKFFSQANQTYAGRGHADTSKKKPIVNPHVVLFGTSVRESVLGSITEENMTDGFISRLLIFESSNDNPEAVRRPYIGPPPGKLIEEIEWWGRYLPPAPFGSGNLAHMNATYPRLIDDGPGVEDLFFDADKRFRSLQNPDQIGSAIWTRAHEKARTLALIWQCSSDCQSEIVTMDAANWSLELVEHLTRRIILLANEWVADNRQGRLINKVLRKMREKGGEMPAHAITKLLQKDAQAKEVRDLLDTLLLSGTLLRNERSTNGRVGIFFQMNA